MGMTRQQIAEITLNHGLKYPYDGTDEWWLENDGTAPAPVDWAHAAARGILSDLNDRRGIKHGFAGLDEDIRAEIVAALAEIIRAAYRKGIS